MNDEINLTKTIMDIYEKVTSIQKDVQHLTQRMDSIDSDTRELEKRLDKVEAGGAKKKAEMFDYVVKGIVTVAISFAAVRLGLK